MNKKVFKNIGKLIAVLALVLAAVVINKGVHVSADNGETVRVTTAKELKAAIKNADVGTIIFRTNAYINVTIKADKAAKSKSLIIDAEHADITNKAVFADINIISADQYTENASGNRISLSDSYLPGGLTIAKKKKVASLTIYDSQGFFGNIYTLRKGAKISELKLVYSGDLYPIESNYNKSKRQLTLKCTNEGCELAYTIKLDKSGRMVSVDCKSNWPETDYDEAYTYDSNGNIVKESGNQNMSGKYTTEITYSGNLRVKSVYKGTYGSGVYTYTYDKKGRLIHDEYTGEESIDGIPIKSGSFNDYEYDKNGRLSFERWEDTQSDYFYETSYTYDSKGYLIEMNNNIAGSESSNKYKYDKAGNLIQMTYTSEGYNETYNYEYDEFGARKNGDFE